MDEIKSLSDVKPGDIMFGPIGGLVGIGVGLGQLALGEAFRVGKLSVRHVGIVVESGRTKYSRATPDAPFNDVTHYGPRLVQAMPHGAEEIELTESTHWTSRHAYVRLAEDYPGQRLDAAAIARLMVEAEVAYSPASYLALAGWRWGMDAPKLEAWIDRRRSAVWEGLPSGASRELELPVEAICSVLVDQCWSLTGKRVVQGVPHQAVTPGTMAEQLWRRPGTIWGGKGLL